MIDEFDSNNNRVWQPEVARHAPVTSPIAVGAHMPVHVLLQDAKEQEARWDDSAVQMPRLCGNCGKFYCTLPNR